MSDFVVVKQPRPIYKVSLGRDTGLKLGVFSPSVRGTLVYDLETPANSSIGVLNLVSSKGTTDTVPIIGGGIASVTSNGSAIIVSASANTVRLDTLADVVEVGTPANNSTLVYNNTTDKYEVKEINLDGGSF